MITQDQKPLITTIIPTFRRPKLLRRAIRSVLNQTCPHFQVCVYDNASGDETGSVAEEFSKNDPRVHYYCHAENIGGLKNFIYGAERVETPFFSFLSDDDLLLPNFFHDALAGFEKHPEAILSALATLQVDRTGATVKAPLLRWKAGLYPPPAGLEAILRYEHPEWTSVLFRREAWVETGGLDEAVGNPSDLDFEMRIAARFPIVVSTEPGAVFSIHSSSHSSVSRFQVSWLGWERMIHNLAEDERIPSDVRTHAERVLKERLKRNLLWDAFGATLRKNWLYADEIAEVLCNRYNSRSRAYLLRSLSRTFRCFPPAYYISISMNGLRKALRDFYARRIRKAFWLPDRALWPGN